MRAAARRMQLVYPQDSCYTQLRIMRGIVHQSGAKRSTEHSVLILLKPAPEHTHTVWVVQSCVVFW